LGSHRPIVALEAHAESPRYGQIDSAPWLIGKIGDGIADPEHRRAGSRGTEQHLRKRVDAGVRAPREPWTAHERVDAQFRFIPRNRERPGAAADFTDGGEPTPEMSTAGHHPSGRKIGREIRVLLRDVLIAHELVAG